MIAFASDQTFTKLLKLSLNGDKLGPVGYVDDGISGLPALSPDGEMVAYRSVYRGHLWITDFRTGSTRLLTAD